MFEVGGFQTAAITRMPDLGLLKISCNPDSDVDELLQIPPQLQQLQHLELRYITSIGLHIWDPDSAAAAAASCAAFTASSQLTALVQPAGAVQQMFSDGKQLPELRQLSVSSELYTECLRSDGQYTAQDLERFALKQMKALGRCHCLAASALGHLAGCCPNLCDLEMLWAAAGSSSSTAGGNGSSSSSSSSSSVSELLPLLQLTALTRLAVAGGGWDDAAAAAVLAHMTGGSLVTRFGLLCMKSHAVAATGSWYAWHMNALLPAGLCHRAKGIPYPVWSTNIVGWLAALSCVASSGHCDD
jgi:hypothetical protein